MDERTYEKICKRTGKEGKYCMNSSRGKLKIQLCTLVDVTALYVWSWRRLYVLLSCMSKWAPQPVIKTYNLILPFSVYKRLILSNLMSKPSLPL